jgi:heat shock protein HslJ
MKQTIIVLFVLSIALFIGACDGSDSIDASQLAGQTWILTTYDDIQPIPDHQPTLQFEDGQVSGTTGCNHYGGSYQIKGDAIRFEALYNTEMACLEPEGLMEQEESFMKLLGAANRFELVDGVLTIFTGLGQTLIFEIQ